MLTTCNSRTPLLVKNTQTRNRRGLFRPDKGHLRKSSHLMVKDGKISPKTRKRTRHPLALFLFNIVLKTLSRGIRQDKEIRYICIRKEELISNCWRYYLLCENAKHHQQAIRSNKCVKQDCRYKINIQKSIEFSTLAMNNPKMN